MIINKFEVLNQDLSFFHTELKDFPYLINRNEHYGLLKYLSWLKDNQIILDLGTSRGHSALALSQNFNNKVITYDLIKESNLLDGIRNIQRKILDCNQESLENIGCADIILLDVDPHEGGQEITFYNRLKLSEFKGILICDDIHLNPAMDNFWNQIIEEKYDLTEIGHWSGTGLVNFSKEGIKII